MRRSLLVVTALLMAVPLAVAQDAPPAPPQPPAHPPARAAAPAQPRRGLEGEAKLRYIVKQLDLDASQQEHAAALIDIYKQELEADRANAINRIQEIRSILVEIQDAEKAGDAAKVAQLKASLEDYRTGVVPERNFFESLIPVLNDGQKKTLEEVRERLKANPDVQLTPADVLKAARDQSLTEEQNKKLAEVQESLRTKQTQAPAGDAGAQTRMLDEFIRDVRAILDPAQAEKFDKQIAKLRPDPAPAAAPGAPVPVAAPGQPATPPAPPPAPPAPKNP